jgi:predicted nucleic acid-binding protein
MARYLVDTATLIDFAKGFEPARSELLRLIAAGDEVGVCGVNVAEFFAGLAPEDRAVWDEFFGALPLWPITYAAARQAGLWRYAFSRQGVQLTTADTLIGAVALEQQATVLTRNVRDFPMPELRVLSLQ